MPTDVDNGGVGGVGNAAGFGHTLLGMGMGMGMARQNKEHFAP
jgi:hypothetical protein